VYTTFDVKEIVSDSGATPVSRSTPTATVVNLAREDNVTLLGYVRKNSGFVYSGETRLI